MNRPQRIARLQELMQRHLRCHREYASEGAYLDYLRIKKKLEKLAVQNVDRAGIEGVTPTGSGDPNAIKRGRE